MNSRNLVAAVLLLLGTGVAAQAQSITNGNFATDLSGWTTQGPFTQWFAGSGPDSLIGVAWLNDNPNIDSFIQQTISGLTSGQTYTINGFYKTHALFFTAGSFTATIDGVTKFANPETSRVTNWTPFGFQFTPVATSAVLRLNSQVGSDSDYDVDNISIARVGVNAPEPGSLALLALAVLPMVGVLRNRISLIQGRNQRLSMNSR